VSLEIVQSFSALPRKRKAVRAVAFCEGKLFLMHVRSSDTYVLPGGGVQNGETVEEALFREIREETGYNVKNFSFCLTITEKHERYYREHHIYKVVLGKTAQKPSPTEEERRLNIHPIKVGLFEALDLLGFHQGSHEYSDAIQTREFMAVLHSA